jgi:hypothetical protein
MYKKPYINNQVYQIFSLKSIGAHINYNLYLFYSGEKVMASKATKANVIPTRKPSGSTNALNKSIKRKGHK